MTNVIYLPAMKCLDTHVFTKRYMALWSLMCSFRAFDVRGNHVMEKDHIGGMYFSFLLFFSISCVVLAVIGV